MSKYSCCMLTLIKPVDIITFKAKQGNFKKKACFTCESRWHCACKVHLP